MNVSVSQSNLAHALSIVSHAVAAKSTLAILVNILITTEDGQLRLSATNLELGINYWIPAQIDEEGAVTVPAKLLIDLVNTLPEDNVQLKLDTKTQTLSVRCLQIVTDIKGIGAEEFPPMPVFDASEAIAFDMFELRKMIQQVAFAASSDDARPVLQGVFLNVSGNEMAMVATDGFRIAVKNIVLKEKFDQPISAIIPARALLELVRITSDSDKQVLVTLSTGKMQVIFHLSNVELASQIIAGTYVDYKAIIPKNFQTTTVVSTASLLKACSQAMIIARDSKNLTRLNILGSESGKGKIQITAQSEETGFYENFIEANVDGPDIQIAFNVRFLKEVMEIIDSPNVSIQTNTSMSPGLIVPLDEDKNFRYVIMPMHFG
ncbi:MAG: DNA polymerase III subunit beta [Flexilinea sp.]